MEVLVLIENAERLRLTLGDRRFAWGELYAIKKPLSRPFEATSVGVISGQLLERRMAKPKLFKPSCRFCKNWGAIDNPKADDRWKMCSISHPPVEIPVRVPDGEGGWRITGTEQRAERTMFSHVDYVCGHFVRGPRRCFT